MAAGLQAWTVSAASLGDLGAGAAASANNPDTSYYNPAGSPWIQHQDMGFSFIAAQNKATFHGTVIPTPSISGLTQTDPARGDHWLYTPNLFYVAPLSEQWAVGLSVSSPYADNVEYGTQTPLRYLSNRWYLTTNDIMPSIAYRFIPQFSVGAGIDFEHATFHIDSMTPGTVVNSPIISDTKTTADFGSWGIGFTLGGIWQPENSTRIGLAYHSSVRQDGWSNTHEGAIYREQYVYRLPASETLSIDQQLNTKVALLGSLNYTQYQGKIPTVMNAKNNWLASMGLHYQWLSSLMLKTGLGYQQGAVSSNQLTPIYPDLSQYLIGLGANIKFNSSLNLDAGYRYAFSRTHTISSTQCDDGGGYSFYSNGSLKTSSNSLGLQLNWVMT